VFEYPTPGAANSVASPHAVVYINEWIADNTKTLLDPSDSRYQDWFELYNPSAEAVNLGGYWINDENTLSNAFMVPSWVSIPARGFLVVWADDDEEQNRPGEMLHISFNLSKTGDTIRVFAPDGMLLDAVSFGPQASDVSEGRVPDGVGAVTTLPTPTPGAANSGVVIVPTPPAVNNGGGATSVEAFAAVLNGNLVSGGIAQVWIYLGTADGASNKAAWAQSLPVGLQATGAFARAAGGLESARRYYYRCFASNVAGQAWAPTAATFTTLTWVETNRPSAPADLAAAVMSPLQVDLSWRDTATNETGFELQRRIEGGAYAPIGSAAANATGYSDMTVGAGTTYTYRVRASGAAGPSDYSNEARAEVLTEVLRVCACVADSYLYLDGGTGRTNCYGGLDIMYTDGNASHSLLDIRDALLLFDLSGLPALAPSRATLRLYCVGERYPTTAGRLEVHGVLQPWTEAEVTWSNRAFGAPWSGSRFEPGGGANYLAAAAASREAPTTDDWTSTWVEMDVTSLARDWLAARLPNYGLAVFSFSSSGGGKRFDFMTREAAINRPELHLTFSAPPPRPRITAMLPPAGSSSLLTWGAVSGAVYRLEYSANLLIPGWTVIGVQTATSSSISMPDPTAGRAPRRFYRTVRQ
jgi:hypothetical protein